MKASALAAAFVVLATSSAPGLAQTRITGASPPSLKALDVYSRPGAPQPDETMDLARITLPAPVLEAQDGFLKIVVNGRELWVQSAQVRIARAIPTVCDPQNPQPMRTAATPGATATSCDKR